MRTKSKNIKIIKMFPGIISPKYNIQIIIVQYKFVSNYNFPMYTDELILIFPIFKKKLKK